MVYILCRQAFLDRNAISRVFLSEVVSLRKFYLIRDAVVPISGLRISRSTFILIQIGSKLNLEKTAILNVLYMAVARFWNLSMRYVAYWQSQNISCKSP